jgi:nitroreductase
MVETKVVKTAVQTACRAPSLHNSQPWQWVFDGNQLRLFLDPTRVMDTDRSGRQALIGCGAALDHLRVAMAAAGWQTHADRFPNADNPDHLASMNFTQLASVTDDDRRRASAIGERRTDRLPFAAPPDRESLERSLRRSVDGSGVQLDVLPDDVRPQLAWASQFAESLRLYDTAYHSELHWWTSPFEAAEGIPYTALVSAAEGGRVDIERVFPHTHNPERRTGVPEDHSMILVLSTDDDSRAAALASGQALSAVLLECTMAGLATCPVSHLTELKSTRQTVSALLDHDARPQILVRVGMAPAMEKAPPPTPRRPLAEVLILRSHR